MTCQATDALTELAFVQALSARGPEHSDCAGPKLHLMLPGDHVWSLDPIFDSCLATDLLWSGFLRDGPEGMEFALCAGHWFDLTSLLWVRSVQHGRRDWAADAEVLVEDLCFAARWDAKEMVNMFSWQRLRLT